MNRIIKLLSLVLLTVTLSAQTVNLELIETSDVHGQLFPYDFINDRPAKVSLAQIYTYVKNERAEKNNNVILLDDGDLLQGQPIVYYYNFERPDTTHILASMMNYMKYDAATIGNHDIEAGHPVYDRVAKEFNFPWMAANAVKNNSDKPYFKPYTIINKDGIKVAVLGLITPHIPHWLPENIWEGMHFTDMIKSAAKWVKIIKEKENPDLLIGLFHAGIDYNYGGENANTPLNENASQLVAEQVPGFDVVFVGHDHQGWNKWVTNSEGDSVLILGTKGYASTATAAKIKLTFDKSSNSWNTNTAGYVINTADYEPDAEFVKKFNYAFRETQQYVSKRIGEITETISAKDALFGDSPFTDLIHNIQLDLTKADVSFTSPLSFNAVIHKGPLFIRDMFNLYKYENLLYTMALSGQEIKDYLEYSYSLWFNQMKDENDDLLNFVKDKDGNIKWSERSHSPMLVGRYYNFDSAEGIDYTVDVSKPYGKRITIKGFSDGRPFELDKIYNVALNSYRGNGGGGHLTKGAGIPQDKLADRIVNSTDKDLRYYLMKWIENEKVVDPYTTDNWKVIPTEWYERGKEKDYKLLFGK